MIRLTFHIKESTMQDLQIKDVISIDSKKELLEQYKMVVTSIDNTNQTRESLNTFWTSSHSIMLTALAFFMNNASLNYQQKVFLMWTVGLIGSFLCISWIQAISTIIKSIQLRNVILMRLEQYFPANIFSVQILNRKSNTSTEKLSLKEIQVPIFFLIGYIILTIYMTQNLDKSALLPNL
jgi:hypothetical protein